MKTIVFITLLFSAHFGHSTNYYVSSSTGDDNRTDLEARSPLTPWRTLQKINSLMALSPGDSVFFKRGEIYFGTLNVVASGSLRQIIFYGAYGEGENPVISGLKSLSGWVKVSDNIYYAPVNTENIEMVVVNGSVRGMGRFPNNGFLKLEKHHENKSITDYELTGMVNWEGAEIVMRKYRWIIDRHPIISHSGNTLTYSSLATYGNNNAYYPVDGNGYFIQNHISTLDVYGEWFYDPSLKRFYMHFAGINPEQTNVEVSVAAKNVVLNTKKHIQFKGLTFTGGNREGVQMIGCERIDIEDCNFTNQGGSAIYGLSVQSIKVLRGYVTNSLSNGIFFEHEADRVTIHGVSVKNTNLIPGSGRSGDAVGAGITVTGNNAIISNNKVVNSGYNGIQFFGNNVLVEQNFVDSFCTIKDDGGGIYTYETAPRLNSNRVIRNNIILNAIGAFEGAEVYFYEPFGKAAGIYLDGYSNNVEVLSNTIAHGEWAGIFVNNNFNNQMLRNTIYNTSIQLLILAFDSQIKNISWNSNKFVSKTTQQSALKIESYTNTSINSFATADSNVYARPVDDREIIITDNRAYGGSLTHHTLQSWKQIFGKDKTSIKSPYEIDTASNENLIFHYNATNEPKTISLTGPYVDLENTLYSTSATVKAYGSIILLKDQFSLLASASLSLSAIKKGRDIEITWELTSGSAIKLYELQWSRDGTSFRTKHSLGASESKETKTGIWNDMKPGMGNHYYRIRAFTNDGSILHSAIVKVQFEDENPSVKLFPNPVTDQGVKVRLEAIAKGKYRVTLLKSDGKILMEETKYHSGGDLEFSFPTDKLITGAYCVILEGDKILMSQKFLKL